MHLECLLCYSGFFLAAVKSAIHLHSLCDWDVLIGYSQKQREREHMKATRSETISFKPVLPDLTLGHTTVERRPGPGAPVLWKCCPANSTRLQFPGQRTTCMPSREVAVRTVARRKSGEKGSHAVGRGTAREGASLRGKRHQYLLVYSDGGGQKIAPEVTLDGGLGLPQTV